MNFPTGSDTMPTARPLFDWTNILGATSYTLQISTDQAFTRLVVNLNVSTSAYAPMADLPRNTLLFWRVRGNADSRPGLWSRTRHFFSADPPGAPNLLSPANGAETGAQPTLDWSDSIPVAAYYEVQISMNADFTALLGRGQSGRANVSTYTLETALAPATTYYWRVRGVKGEAGISQVGQWSTAQNFHTP